MKTAEFKMYQYYKVEDLSLVFILGFVFSVWRIIYSS